MTAVEKLRQISVEEYLSDEFVSPIKHEYLNGAVEALPGECYAQNTISLNISASLHSKLRGQKRQSFGSDMKVRVKRRFACHFYYPDAVVAYDPSSSTESYLDAPVAIAEVVSESTRRIDICEKLEAYLTIPSLMCYLIVEQSVQQLIAYRRTSSGFDREEYNGLESTVPLPEIDTELAFSEISERLNFPTEEAS